jgi:hypothetical protein
VSLRILVGWREVPSRQDRMVRDLLSGVMVRMNDERRQHYWCAADKPDADEDTFAIRPIYRSHKIPEDARCEVCDVSLRDLQQMFTDTLASSREEKP